MSSVGPWATTSPSPLSFPTRITGEAPSLLLLIPTVIILTKASTGVSGVVGILSALMRRAEEGGSFTVNVALNYYSQWLVDSCGVYPEAVWQNLWKRNGSPVFRHYHHMAYTIPRTIGMIKTNSADKVFKPEFFSRYHVKTVGKDIQIVAPVLQFPGGEVEPGYTIGTRTNGVDKPRWPEDLSVEVVA